MRSCGSGVSFKVSTCSATDDGMLSSLYRDSSRYLKVTTFEDILHRAAGRHGLIGSRAVQLTGILLIASAWLRGESKSLLLPGATLTRYWQRHTAFSCQY